MGADAFIPNQVSASQEYEAGRTVRSTPGTLLGLTGYNSKGSAQFIQIHDATGKPTAEVFSAQFVGLTGATMKGQYMLCHDANGSVYIWGDDGVVSDPAPAGIDRGIAFTIVGDADDDLTLAAAFQAAVDADAQFSCTVGTTECTVTNAFVGTREDATAGSSGISIATTVQGVGNGSTPVAIITAATVANFEFQIPQGGWPFEHGIYVTNSSAGPTFSEGSADCTFSAIFK